MVSFKPQGRLGNFLFCAAATIAYALKNKIEFTMPSKTDDGYWNPIYLQHLVNFKWKNENETVTLSEIMYFRYDELPFWENWREKQILLNGFFQNPKYFQEYRKDILKFFAFPWKLKTGFVSVHVRRGDYLRLRNKHPEVSVDWYKKSMGFFKNKKFMFFSDDIRWCKEIFGDRNDCLFSKNNSEIDDLIDISCCEHHINSSSTFSWWGAWLNLNPHKVVITPKQWFMPSHTNEWTKEIIPKQWFRL